MTSMQSPKEFIWDYLREQVRLQELWSANYKPIHERFFEPSYTPFDPRVIAKGTRFDTRCVP